MELRNKRKFLIGMIHVMVWIIVFSIPMFMWRNIEITLTWSHYFRFLMVPLLFMSVFYLNYIVLVEKLLFRKKISAYIFINIGIILLCTALIYYGQDFIMPPKEPAFEPPPHHQGKERPMPLFWLRDGLILALMAGLALAVRVTMQWFETEQERQSLDAARVEAELKNLKNQLNPHFLFNTLNNIYALIESNPEKARYAVEGLSGMLRHVLYDTNSDRIPLDQELSFIRNYIELMALRLPASIRLEVDIPQEGKGVFIAPLLFISLIENAFKHGVSHKKDSFILVSIRFDEKNRIICTVENTYISRYHERSDSGIGIENLERRLMLLYPDRYEFRRECDGQVYRSLLMIDL